MNKRNNGMWWGGKSMMVRLLVPINIITFVVITGLSVLMVVEQRNSLETSLMSKMESTAGFLESVGQTYISNYDLTALEGFTKIASNDSDVAFAIYYDKDGRAVTDASKIASGANVIQIEKNISDLAKNKIGKVVIGYKRDRIQAAFYGAITLGFFCVVLMQLLLSAAIYFVVRGLLKPFQLSLGKLSKSTMVLSETSQDVSKFSESISVGGSQQAEVVQETTSAMSEMSSMLSQATDYTKQSEAVMSGMTQKANNGMQIMKRLVDSMASVQQANEQLKQMVQIIREITNKTNVINDIVFKTQLLSFNASIEAARAGQHGRGFAVVAEEVGNLAKTSGAAAQAIGALLQDSEKQVNEIVKSTDERVKAGRDVTEQAMKSFEEIAGDIETTSTNIANISSAAREQGLGIAQTTQAMAELNKTTDLNSQVAQKSSQTAHLLKNEVMSLKIIASTIQALLSGDQEKGDKYGSVENFNYSQKTDQRGAENTNADLDIAPAIPHDMNNLTDMILKMAQKKINDKSAEPFLTSTQKDGMKKTG